MSGGSSPPLVDVVVVGAGHAGLAMSRCLEEAHVAHVVLERGSIASAWKSRWDSLHLVTPNALVRLPGRRYECADPEGFLSRDDFVAWLEQYARELATPVRSGVDVRRVRRRPDALLEVETTEGVLVARHVIAATGAYAKPEIPSVSSGLRPDLVQVHSSEFKNAGGLPPGGVLVVGSGQSGVQIAGELLDRGRPVTLCTSPCGWVPRRYRGRDILTWAGEIGFYDRRLEDVRNPALARSSSSPQLSGQRGGETVNLRVLAKRGARVLGRLIDADGDVVRVDDSLLKTLRFGDEFAKNFLSTVDAHARKTASPIPAEAWHELPWQGHVPIEPVRELRLRQEGIACVLWATGYGPDLSWLPDLPFDADGAPIQVRGATPIDGVWLLGQHFQYRRDSALIHGVEEDARYLAERIRRRLP